MDMTTDAAQVARHEAARGAQPARAGEYLSFRLGAEEYGIDLLTVQEIRSYEAPTRLASAPAFIKGVVNLRGVIVPIVDLRLKFDIAQAAYDSFTVVIVLNIRQRVVGVVVDSVSDVLALKPEQIKPAPEFNAVVDTAHITGLGSVPQPESDQARERMLVLIDVEQLMSSAEMGLFSPAMH
jgi:purine-binding chemotaxis protein CheW